MTRVASEAAVDMVLEAIREEIKAGRSIVFKGFGTFSPVVRKARTCPNPQTGGTVKVAARATCKFKASKTFLSA